LPSSRLRPEQEMPSASFLLDKNLSSDFGKKTANKEAASPPDPRLNPLQFGETDGSKHELESGVASFPPFDEVNRKITDVPKQSTSNKQEMANSITITTPMPGSVISILVKEGEKIRAGQELVVIEAMKMESLIKASHHGIIHSIPIKEGDVLTENQAVIFIQASIEQAKEQAITKSFFIR